MNVPPEQAPRDELPSCLTPDKRGYRRSGIAASHGDKSASNRDFSRAWQEECTVLVLFRGSDRRNLMYGRAATATLIFLPRPARTWIISPDLIGCVRRLGSASVRIGFPVLPEISVRFY